MEIIKDKDIFCEGEDTQNIIKTIPTTYEPKDDDNLGSVFFNSLNIFKDKLAQINSITAKEETFGDLQKKAIRLAIHLKNEGITRSDKICMCSEPTMESILPFIAAQYLGSTFCTLDERTTVLDNKYLLGKITPSIMFASQTCEKRIEESLKEANLTNCKLIIMGKTKRNIPFEKYIQPHDEELTFEPVKIENNKETAVILFSSGTTGLPKGLCLSHYSILAQIRNAMTTHNIDTDFVKYEVSIAAQSGKPLIMLTHTSMYGISGIIYCTSSIIVGLTRLVDSKFDVNKIWQLLEEYKVFLVFLSPSIIKAMVKHGKPTNCECKFLRRIILGGSATPTNTILEMRKLLPGCLVYQNYSLTEIIGCTLGFQALDKHHRELIEKHPDSIGVPFPGMTLRVVDLATEKNVGPNVEGELRIKTKYIMTGFYNQDCSDCFDKFGWFKTGDLVKYDEDGCFYFVERIKEVIKYNSWPVIPASLEMILLTHPDIKDAVVIGIPDEEFGELPMGIIVLHQGSKLTVKDVENFIDDKTNDWQKLRGGIKFVDKLPYTPTDKISRREVKRMAINGEL